MPPDDSRSQSCYPASQDGQQHDNHVCTVEVETMKNRAVPVVFRDVEQECDSGDRHGRGLGNTV